MSEVINVARGSGETRTNVIFLHGLGGNLRSTWQSGSDDRSFWPRWLADDIEGLAIYVVGYEAPISRWRGTAMHLTDRATNVLARLLAEPHLRQGKIILIGHSLGGLVIKQLLRTGESEARHRADVADLIARIDKIAFLATPHTGSGLASVGDRLRILVLPSAATTCLVRNDPNLRDLNLWYRDWADAQNIPHLTLTETEPIRILGMIVKPDSSDPGLPGFRPVPISANHWTICKPVNRKSDTYLQVRTFIERRFERPPQSVKRLPVSNIPIRVPTHFMGRDDALAAIETELRRHEGRVAITALHGLRGVGKTMLAAAYTERHRGGYRATWWIRAQADSALRADLVALGIRLGWVSADVKEEPAVEAVMQRLRHEGEGILLIFDNAVDADALKPYLPRGGAARVLVTSNAHAWRGVAVPVEIRVWPKATGGDYLIARTGLDAERIAAEALSQALGGLPLAHEQAAAYCERLDVSLAEYRKRFEATPTRLLDDARHAPAEYHDGLTVAKTFALAIEEAAKFYPAAEPLIVHAALLAPEPIPLFLFSEAHEKFGEPLASAVIGDGLDEAVAALRAFALVDREAIVDELDASITTDAIRLHRLVREVAAARREVEPRDQLRRAIVAALVEVYPIDGFRNPASWSRCVPLTPHLLSVCEMEMADAAANAERAELLNRAGSYFHGRAAYSAARPLYERALAIAEKTLGPEHPDTATSLNNLATLLQDQGDLAGARPLFERALAISEKTLGPDHPETATSLNNLATLLHAQGDLPGARPLLERALAIIEKALGPEHPDTATSLNNLSRLLRVQGDLAGARPLLERALAIREQVLGPEHPHTALSLNNLAGLLQDQGDLAGARPLFERALAISEKTLGPDHPETATNLGNLAILLQDQGDHAGARPLYERALAIAEKTLGPEHPDTATSLNNLATLLHAQGDLPGAQPLYERALAIAEKTLGPEHPDTAMGLNNLAGLLRAQSDLAGARPLYERALAIREKAFGPEHPDTATSRNNLARVIQALGDLAGAQPSDSQ
jgi:tetratricopeptide (TPR) repeat protein/pimeloyl-ACP methyl ester carboxylesterase